MMTRHLPEHLDRAFVRRLAWLSWAVAPKIHDRLVLDPLGAPVASERPRRLHRSRRRADCRWQGVGAEGTTAANSQVRHAGTFGVLQLTLRAHSYDWQFIPIAGSTFTDSGTQATHS